MKKSEIKIDAQDALMEGMQLQLSRMRENEDLNDTYDEAIRQFRRVEKRFGYEIGSWNVGA